jgi:hypothetical protein
MLADWPVLRSVVFSQQCQSAMQEQCLDDVGRLARAEDCSFLPTCLFVAAFDGRPYDGVGQGIHSAHSSLRATLCVISLC